MVLVDPNAGGASKGANLVAQIAQVAPSLPTTLRDFVDLIRKVGNSAAHPDTDKNTGTIVDVEESEAEFLLDLLARCFDHFYVSRAKDTAAKQALEAKYLKGQKP